MLGRLSKIMSAIAPFWCAKGCSTPSAGQPQASQRQFPAFIKVMKMTISCVKPEFQLFAAPGDGEKY